MAEQSKDGFWVRRLSHQLGDCFPSARCGRRFGSSTHGCSSSFVGSASATSPRSPRSSSARTLLASLLKRRPTRRRLLKRRHHARLQPLTDTEGLSGCSRLAQQHGCVHCQTKRRMSVWQAFRHALPAESERSCSFLKRTQSHSRPGQFWTRSPIAPRRFWERTLEDGTELGWKSRLAGTTSLWQQGRACSRRCPTWGSSGSAARFTLGTARSVRPTTTSARLPLPGRGSRGPHVWCPLWCPPWRPRWLPEAAPSGRPGRIEGSNESRRRSSRALHRRPRIGRPAWRVS